MTVDDIYFTKMSDELNESAATHLAAASSHRVGAGEKAAAANSIHFI